MKTLFKIATLWLAIILFNVTMAEPPGPQYVEIYPRTHQAVSGHGFLRGTACTPVEILINDKVVPGVTMNPVGLSPNDTGCPTPRAYQWNHPISFNELADTDDLVHYDIRHPNGDLDTSQFYVVFPTLDFEKQKRYYIANFPFPGLSTELTFDPKIQNFAMTDTRNDSLFFTQIPLLNQIKRLIGYTTWDPKQYKIIVLVKPYGDGWYTKPLYRAPYTKIDESTGRFSVDIFTSRKDHLVAAKTIAVVVVHWNEHELPIMEGGTVIHPEIVNAAVDYRVIQRDGEEALIDPYSND